MSSELLTTKEMKKADELAIAGGISGSSLMERAGESVASIVRDSFREQFEVLILCGPGDNGGDGFVVARLLADDGYPVSVLFYGSRETLTGDAREKADNWIGTIEELTPAKLEEYLHKKSRKDVVIIDALFGAGLNRPLEGEIARCVNTLNMSDFPVVSIDVPSGICGDSGLILGTAVVADLTVTFFRLKPGHLLYPGKELCGQLKLSDIGIPSSVLNSVQPKITSNEIHNWDTDFPRIDLVGHKYNRGHVVVVSGPVHKTGAARLGAKGALTAGAGLVTVFSPVDAIVVNASHLTAIMLEPFDTTEDLGLLLQDKRKNAILIGPGAGVNEKTRSNVLACLEARAHVVLDADALTCFEGNNEAMFTAIRNKTSGAVILTPHEGEYKRLFSEEDSQEKEISKIDKAITAARLSGAIIVLKGADTVISSPDGRVSINQNASPWLATAGSGDVLAGIITSLLAQGMEGFEAACAAVWIHGEAGKLFGPGLIAEDIPDLIPEILDIILNRGEQGQVQEL